VSTPKARYLRLSSVGMLDLLAPCSGISELLAPERRVLDVTLNNLLTTDSSLSLAEISSVRLSVASAPLGVVFEIPVP
jgi:hypothetical protein